MAVHFRGRIEAPFFQFNVKQISPADKIDKIGVKLKTIVENEKGKA